MRDAAVIAARKRRAAAEAKAKRKQEAEYARQKHEASYDRIFEHTDQVGLLSLWCNRRICTCAIPLTCCYALR